jgi:hypothetical protein
VPQVYYEQETSKVVLVNRTNSDAWVPGSILMWVVVIHFFYRMQRYIAAMELIAKEKIVGME